MIEEWRPIPNWEGLYEVSDHGRVRNARNGRIMRALLSSRGYPRVGLSRDGRQKEMKVHRAVALAFVANPQSLPEINHKDLDKTNNRPANLEWVTSKQNMAHCIAAGRQTAITNPNKAYKYTPEVVADIRARYAAGESIASITARHPGSNRPYVSNIATGRVRRYEPGASGSRRRRISPETYQAIREAYASGLTSSECAARFDVSASSVYDIVQSGGIPLRPVRVRKMTAEKAAELRAMYANGARINECAKRFDIAVSTAWGIVCGYKWKATPAAHDEDGARK